jgi:sulfonate transport system permease protein
MKAASLAERTTMKTREDAADLSANSWTGPALRGSAQLLRPLLLPAMVLAVWAVFTLGGFVPNYLLPSPVDVVNSLVNFVFGGRDDANSGMFVVHFWASFQRVLGGFAVGSLLGIPLGILLGYSNRLAAYIEPFIQLTRSIPGICWLPLAIIWFGIGATTSIFLIALGSFYAVFVSTVGGVRYVDPVLLRAGRSLGATENALLYTVILPAAFPSILSGLRLGLSYSWIYMVLGEFTGVNIGLGALLLQSRETMDTPLIIASMIIIGLLGVITDWLMLMFMRHVLRMNVK